MICAGEIRKVFVVALVMWLLIMTIGSCCFKIVIDLKQNFSIGAYTTSIRAVKNLCVLGVFLGRRILQ